MNERAPTVHSFYAVESQAGVFFAGFDPAKGKASFVDDPKAAKLFTNKYQIPLRPGEMLRELLVDFITGGIEISEPFRPKRRVERQES